MKIRGGFISKPERHTSLPDSLVRKMYRATESSTLPFFRQQLANGLLSWVARWGEYRHIDFERRMIFDSLVGCRRGNCVARRTFAVRSPTVRWSGAS